MHVDETYEDCAVREVFEETGTPIELGPRLNDIVMERKTVVSFLARPTERCEPRFDGPHSEVHGAGWFIVGSLPRIIPYQHGLLKEALKRIRIRHAPLPAIIEEAVSEAMTEVHSYAGHVDDWIVIKKELLKSLSSEFRSLMSTRDPITKEQRANDFELRLAERWEGMTGRKVIVKQ